MNENVILPGCFLFARASFSLRLVNYHQERDVHPAIKYDNYMLLGNLRNNLRNRAIHIIPRRLPMHRVTPHGSMYQTSVQYK